MDVGVQHEGILKCDIGVQVELEDIIAETNRVVIKHSTTVVRQSLETVRKMPVEEKKKVLKNRYTKICYNRYFVIVKRFVCSVYTIHCVYTC